MKGCAAAGETRNIQGSLPVYVVYIRECKQELP